MKVLDSLRLWLFGMKCSFNNSVLIALLNKINKSIVFNHFKPSEDGVKYGWISPNISWMVVAGNEDLLWPDLSRGSFDLCRKWIVICPNLEVVTQACVFNLDVFDEYHGFFLVPIPPFVWHLDVGFWMSCSAM